MLIGGEGGYNEKEKRKSAVFAPVDNRAIFLFGG
jgi:hypothetical protein